MCILSDERYKQKNSTWPCRSPEAVSVPRSCQPSAPSHFQHMFSNRFFQNKNYYQAFFLLHFAWLGYLCLLLISMFICAPKHLRTGSVSREFSTSRMWHCLLRLHLRPQIVGKIQPKHSISCKINLFSLSLLLVLIFLLLILLLSCTEIATSGIFSQQKYYVYFWGEPVD